jgi:phosphoglycolate phosphatase
VPRSVGFDLDMTLVDTGPGIRDALLALAADTGRPIDADEVVAHLGPPVAEALAPWFAATELPAAVESFRQHMARVGVMNVTALPGAAAAIAATRDHGLRVLVVTSKLRSLALDTLRYAGIAADVVVGEVWSGAKAGPLREHEAIAFVGDHPGDMVAAVTARVPGVGVTTGAADAGALRAAGAAVVLTSLEQFPGWLRTAVGP